MRYDDGSNVAPKVQVTFPEWFENRLPEHPANLDDSAELGSGVQWALDGACRETPLPFRRGQVTNAQLVCAGCAVVNKCLENAIRWSEGSPGGILGGLSDKRRGKYTDDVIAGRLAVGLAVSAAKVERDQIFARISTE